MALKLLRLIFDGRRGRMGGRFIIALPLGQFTGEKFDLVADSGVTIDQDEFLATDPATPALSPISRLAQEFLGAHLDVHPLRAQNQFLQASFLLIFRLCHGMSLDDSL
jgi:hypothetical protein